MFRVTQTSQSVCATPNILCNISLNVKGRTNLSLCNGATPKHLMNYLYSAVSHQISCIFVCLFHSVFILKPAMTSEYLDHSTNGGLDLNHNSSILAASSV